MTTEEKKEESQKEEKKDTARRPDYKGDGVSVWVNTRENGQTYLSINIIGMSTIYANKN
jgi:hypothetical protein